ncbi:MAG: hypothetical protein MUF31_07935 [Akkermansiaceae bacterium]|nr:hypothetical protein [Akkermansiaceae bacterium]
MFRGWLPERPTLLLLGWWVGGLVGGFSVLSARVITEKKLKSEWLVDAGFAPFTGTSLTLCLSFTLFSFVLFLVFKSENRVAEWVMAFAIIQAGLVTAAGMVDLPGSGWWIALMMWIVQSLVGLAGFWLLKRWRLQQIETEWLMIRAENDVRRANRDMDPENHPRP